VPVRRRVRKPELTATGCALSEAARRGSRNVFGTTLPARLPGSAFELRRISSKALSRLAQAASNQMIDARRAARLRSP
jgi:hypothetical protein